MVNFAFSEEQELFRQSVREFAQQELAPGWKRADRQDIRRPFVLESDL